MYHTRPRWRGGLAVSLYVLCGRQCARNHINCAHSRRNRPTDRRCGSMFTFRAAHFGAWSIKLIWSDRRSVLFSPNVSEFLLRQPYITDLRIFNSFAYAVYVRTHVRTNVRPFVRSSPGPGKVTSAHRGQVSSVSVHCTPHIRPTCFACRSIIYRCTHVLGICVCVWVGGLSVF